MANSKVSSAEHEKPNKHLPERNVKNEAVIVSQAVGMLLFGAVMVGLLANPFLVIPLFFCTAFVCSLFIIYCFIVCRRRCRFETIPARGSLPSAYYCAERDITFACIYRDF